MPTPTIKEEPKNTKSLWERIFDVQFELGAITKDETNPFFKSKYFDVNGLIRHLKPLLNKNGLVVMQPLTTQDGRMALETIVRTGQEELTRTIILPVNEDPQKQGAIISYFRRYALQSLFLLEAEDDDGNNTAQVKPSPKTVQSPVDAGICPQCGKQLKERTGKYGNFLGCVGYPACKYIVNNMTPTIQPTSQKEYKDEQYTPDEMQLNEIPF